jgi:hypothetical protein
LGEKSWWWQKSTPVVPTGIVFGSFPAALVFFIMAYIFYDYSLSQEQLNILTLYIGSPLILLSVFLAMWRPRFMKPKWLRWLEENHGDIIHLLKEDAFEAEKRQRNSWTNRVKTQEGLEEWVIEVRHKYRLDHPDQRFIDNPHA